MESASTRMTLNRVPSPKTVAEYSLSGVLVMRVVVFEGEPVLSDKDKVLPRLKDMPKAEF